MMQGNCVFSPCRNYNSRSCIHSKEKKSSLDIVRKTVLLGLIMTNHEQKLSPVLLNGLPTVVMDAAVYLLSGAQPTMALRGLGSCLSEVGKVLQDEFERKPADEQDRMVCGLAVCHRMAAICHREAFTTTSSGRSILRQKLFGPYPVPIDCCGMCRFKGVAVLVYREKHQKAQRLSSHRVRAEAVWAAGAFPCYAPEPQRLCAVTGSAQNNLNQRFWSRLSAIEWLPSATERLSSHRVRAEASCAKSFLAHTLFPLTAAECVDSKV